MTDDEKSPKEKKDSSSSWQKWVSNGRASGLAWVTVLVISVGLRIAKIPAPEVDSVLVILTGLFVGNLTVHKSKDGKEDD